MSTLQKIAAANVIRRREAARWPQGELARRAGVSPPVMSQFESGSGNASLATLEKIAVALGVTPVTLLAEPDCMGCMDAPPPGFTCNECGAGHPDGGQS